MRSQPTLNHTGELNAVVLAEKNVRQLVMESRAIFLRLEIALRHAPVADGLGHASHQGAHSTLALGRADRSVQIFTGHDIGGGHRPVFGDFDIFLLEDRIAFGIGDQSRALLPFDFVIGRDAGLGKKTIEGQAWGLLAGCGGSYRGRAGDGGSLGGSLFFTSAIFSLLSW